MKRLMICGATGYIGRMAAEHASTAGTPLIVARRNEATLVSLAASLGVEYRIFALENAAVIDRSRRLLRVPAGERRPGFQTPVTLFGNNFAGTIPDTIIVDV